MPRRFLALLFTVLAGCAFDGSGTLMPGGADAAVDDDMNVGLPGDEDPAGDPPPDADPGAPPDAEASPPDGPPPDDDDDEERECGDVGEDCCEDSPACSG